jgi:hypothetical protein
MKNVSDDDLSFFAAIFSKICSMTFRMTVNIENFAELQVK